MKSFNFNIVKIKEGSEFVGIPALRGKSLYDTAVEHGFLGTEDEWFELLIGDGWITPYQNLLAKHDAYATKNNARTINGYRLDRGSINLTPDDVGAANNQLTNVNVVDFAAKAAEAGITATVGLTATNTTFNDDGSITETYSDGSSCTTVFNEDGSITENHILSNGDHATRITTFGDDGSISQSVTTIPAATPEDGEGNDTTEEEEVEGT